MNRSRILTLLFPLCLLALAATADSAETVTADQVRTWQAERKTFTIVDVRQSQLFLRKHIEGAINIPAFAIAMKGLAKDKDIVLYDNGIGTIDARTAADKLAAAGYGRVWILDNGLADWEAAGLPLKLQSGVLDTQLVEFLTAAELIRAMNANVPMVLVDLRARALFKAGSIPGAVNAAPDDLPSLSAGWTKGRLIVLFDNDNAEPEQQAEQLRRMGFKMVRYLYGDSLSGKSSLNHTERPMLVRGPGRGPALRHCPGLR